MSTERSAEPGPVYRVEVFDLLALARYAVARPEFVTLIEANMTTLNSMARAQRQAFALPGVRVVEDRSVAQRSA